jgi:hypothetical protein
MAEPTAPARKLLDEVRDSLGVHRRAEYEARFLRMTADEQHDELIDAIEALEKAERAVNPPLIRRKPKPRRGRPSYLEADLRRLDQMMAARPGVSPRASFLTAVCKGEWSAPTSVRQATERYLCAFNAGVSRYGWSPGLR